MVIDVPQRSSIPMCRSDGIDRVAPAHMQGTHRLVRLYHNDHLCRCAAVTAPIRQTLPTGTHRLHRVTQSRNAFPRLGGGLCRCAAATGPIRQTLSTGTHRLTRVTPSRSASPRLGGGLCRCAAATAPIRQTLPTGTHRLNRVTPSRSASPRLGGERACLSSRVAGAPALAPRGHLLD